MEHYINSFMCLKIVLTKDLLLLLLLLSTVLVLLLPFLHLRCHLDLFLHFALTTNFKINFLKKIDFFARRLVIVFF